MQSLIIGVLLGLCASAQAFHVTSAEENATGFTIIPFGLQDVWFQIQTIEDSNLFSEFQDLLVKLMEANEDKIQHAKNRILIPLKNHLEKSSEEKLTIFLFD